MEPSKDETRPSAEGERFEEADVAIEVNNPNPNPRSYNQWKPAIYSAKSTL